MSQQPGGFASFIAKTHAVRFGEFLLKSGEKSNVFFDFGQIVTGKEIIELGGFFADFIVTKNFKDADVIFGPAYKGINIAIATSIALFEKYNLSIPFAYNRKVKKEHGESGSFVGFDLTAARSVIVLDDVFTNGGTKYEVIDMLSSFEHLEIKAFIVGVDRQEVDRSGNFFLSEFRERTGVDVFSLATKEEVLALRNSS
jgi:orotate phosphoribosyltransferase